MGKRSAWSMLLMLLLGLMLFSSMAIVASGAETIEDEEDQEFMQESAGADDAAAEVVQEGEAFSAEEEQEGGGPIRQLAPGVETVVLFPNNPNKLCAAGSPVEVLFGINNGGESDLFVSMAVGALILPEYRMIAQNLTEKYYNKTVAPGVHATFEYTFLPSPRLMPRDFSLAAQVVYMVQDKVYVTAFYNGTIEITEPNVLFSGETAFLILLGLGTLGFLVHLAFSQIQKYAKKGKRGQQQPVKKVDSKDENTINEWLEGTSAGVPKAKSAAQNKAKKKKA